MSKYLTEKKWIIVIAIICSILWGSAFPVLKISYLEMGIEADTWAKILLAGMRFFLASAIIFVILKLFIKEPLAVSLKELKRFSILGIFQTAGLYLFFYIGLSNTSGVKGAILSSAENFFVVILAHYIYKNDRITNSKILGLALGFLGIIFANWGREIGFEFSLIGEGFMIISTVSGAIATILCKEICKDIHPFVVNAYQMMIGSLILIILGIVFKGYEVMVFTLLSIGLLAYSALLSSIAFSLWFALLKYNKAGEITIYRFVIPVAGVILSAMFIPGEIFNLYIIISLVCVAFGVASVNRIKS
ncbi:DMT family transporter [Clostridium cylindrosporum]|uniref:Permease of the drug/metabolite transporter (DMT) superfamily n=1 Tax=Clostridium cylindrosporum DSM 605 TaxID=1121307 RepID=A0A0J8D549_CLOCY|nr:DMT family transporter [Clostridium cylindrosporum]KMT20942.1 permease of the drug/metabolite transporter (DMT) superfamily [Clostridium cylindrosporum DSM 605]